MVFYSPDKKYRAYGKLVGLAIGVCLLQVSVVPSLWGLPIAPDFLLLSTLIMAMRMPVFSEMIVFSLLCGLLKDFFSDFKLPFFTPCRRVVSSPGTTMCKTHAFSCV